MNFAVCRNGPATLGYAVFDRTWWNSADNVHYAIVEPDCFSSKPFVECSKWSLISFLSQFLCQHVSVTLYIVIDGRQFGNLEPTFHAYGLGGYETKSLFLVVWHKASSIVVHNTCGKKRNKHILMRMTLCLAGYSLKLIRL